MWFDTRAAILTAGVGEGTSQIVAFDSALRSAAIADFNLIRVTSIVPPRVSVYVLQSGLDSLSGEGCMLPAVYAVSYSSDPGRILSAGVGVGVPLDTNQSGVIFTNDGVSINEVNCIARLESMVEEGMTRLRGINAYEFRCASASTEVTEGGEWRAAVAAVCFADEHLWQYFADAVKIQ
jgi:arginine decarboxylase